MKVLIILVSIMTYCLVESLDPEEELCQEMTIDAAVNADDGQNYIFRGDSYWTVDYKQKDNVGNGYLNKYDISIPTENGKWITDRWPGLPTPIDAAFTIVDVRYNFSTVFIIEKEWFLYKGSEQKAKGLTDSWPDFPKSKVLAAFDYRNYMNITKHSGCSMYILYKVDDTIMFSRYRFNNTVETPLLRESHSTIIEYVDGAIDSSFIWVRYQFDYSLVRSINTLGKFIDVTAVLSNYDEVILFGPKMFANLVYHKNRTNNICKAFRFTGDNVTKAYGCPRSDRAVRVTQKPTTTLKVTTDNPITSPKVSTNALESGNTSINPILSSTPAAGAAVDSTGGTHSGDKSKGGSNWTLISAIICIIIIICVVVLVIIFVTKSKKGNKTDKNNNKKAVSSKTGKRTASSETLSAGFSKGKVSLSDPKKSQTQSHTPDSAEGDDLIQKINSNSLDE